jgi:hypothetical protein
MRRISFALTTTQVQNRTKTVTRRLGWNNLKPGDRLQPIYKGMGVEKGREATASEWPDRNRQRPMGADRKPKKNPSPHETIVAVDAPDTRSSSKTIGLFIN